MEKIFVSVELMRLKQEIVNAVNKSPLSYCLKQMVLNEVSAVVSRAADQEYMHDMAEIEKDKKADGEKEADEKEDSEKKEKSDTAEGVVQKAKESRNQSGKGTDIEKH